MSLFRTASFMVPYGVNTTPLLNIHASLSVASCLPYAYGYPLCVNAVCISPDGLFAWVSLYGLSPGRVIQSTLGVNIRGGLHWFVPDAMTGS